jgi:hypothetical protein
LFVSTLSNNGKLCLLLLIKTYPWHQDLNSWRISNLYWRYVREEKQFDSAASTTFDSCSKVGRDVQGSTVLRTKLRSVVCSIQATKWNYATKWKKWNSMTSCQIKISSPIDARWEVPAPAPNQHTGFACCREFPS